MKSVSHGDSASWLLLCKMQDTGLPAVARLMIPKLVNESVTSLGGLGGVDLPEAFKREIATWPEKPKSRLKTFETASFILVIICLRSREE